MTAAIKTYRRLMLVGTALLGALLLLPASGHAHSGGPPENDCEPAPNVNQEGWGDACFEVVGDDMWVRDQTPNHWSVRVKIEVRNLLIGYRKTRWCANTHGADSWHECKFDHKEDACVRWRMFEQSHLVPIPLNNTQKWTDWSAWHDVATGAAGVDCNWLKMGCGVNARTGDGDPCGDGAVAVRFARQMLDS
jgi:hypothetical protein